MCTSSTGAFLGGFLVPFAAVFVPGLVADAGGDLLVALVMGFAGWANASGAAKTMKASAMMRGASRDMRGVSSSMTDESVESIRTMLSQRRQLLHQLGHEVMGGAGRQLVRIESAYPLDEGRQLGRWAPHPAEQRELSRRLGVG